MTRSIALCALVAALGCGTTAAPRSEIDGGSRGSCSEGELRCDDGPCLPASRKCDGIRDCRGGDDESRCSSPMDGAIPDSGTPEPDTCDFRCPNRDCATRCNVIAECSGGEDELDCSAGTCSGDQYDCGTGACIDVSWICDGEYDCSNGSDETTCGDASLPAIDGCPSTLFDCQDGRCIAPVWVCNEADDCGNGRDEDDC